MTETARLLIRPLKYSELQLYVENNHSLEKELNLEETNITITPEFKEVLEQIILPLVEANESEFEYFTLWTMIDKSMNKMVGDLCFKGLPNDEGAIEIGYGTYEDFRGNGYMTEAVGGLIDWAKLQPDIKKITAMTDKTNRASFTVLQKNGFVKSGESDDLFHWEKELSKESFS